MTDLSSGQLAFESAIERRLRSVEAICNKISKIRTAQRRVCASVLPNGHQATSEMSS